PVPAVISAFPTRRSSDLVAQPVEGPGGGNDLCPCPGLFGRVQLSQDVAQPDVPIVVQRGQVVTWPEAGGAQPGDEGPDPTPVVRSEEHTSELQSRENLVC